MHHKFKQPKSEVLQCYNIKMDKLLHLFMGCYLVCSIETIGFHAAQCCELDYGKVPLAFRKISLSKSANITSFILSP